MTPTVVSAFGAKSKQQPNTCLLQLVVAGFDILVSHTLFCHILAMYRGVARNFQGGVQFAEIFANHTHFFKTTPISVQQLGYYVVAHKRVATANSKYVLSEHNRDGASEASGATLTGDVNGQVM